MSMFLGAIPKSRSGQLAEHLPAIYGEAGSYFPDHESQAAHVTTPLASSHCLQVSPSSGINAPSSIPSRRPSTRRRDPGYIPRARNAFIFFRSAYIRSVRVSGEPQQNELSKLAGIVWNNMSPEGRKPFCELASMEKEQHYAKFPNYVYSPSVKASAKSAGSQKVSGVPRSSEKKRKASMASEYIASRTATPSATPELPMALKHHAEKPGQVQCEPPSPFHAHLDHVTGQFAYQQYIHDFMTTSIPTLPRASLYHQNIRSMTSDMPPVSSPTAFVYPYHAAPSSLLCDNPYPSVDYLTLLNYTFPDGGDTLMQQYMNNPTRQSEFTTTDPDFFVYYQDQDAAVYQFYDFGMGA